MGRVAIPTGVAAVLLAPEAALADETSADGNGRHTALVNLVNVSGPRAEGLTLAGSCGQ